MAKCTFMFPKQHRKGEYGLIKTTRSHQAGEEAISADCRAQEQLILLLPRDSLAGPCQTGTLTFESLLGPGLLLVPSHEMFGSHQTRPGLHSDGNRSRLRFAFHGLPGFSFLVTTKIFGVVQVSILPRRFAIIASMLELNSSWVEAWRGALRTHAADLARLQRILDPLLVTGLYWALVMIELGAYERLSQVPLSWVVVGLTTALILPQGRLYESYRQSSLFTLLRRLSITWLLVLAALLVLAFAVKVSAVFSRQAVFVWAVLSYLSLFTVHVGGRKLLRWRRIQGGNSRTILYWGLPEAAFAYYRRLQSAPYLGLRMVAWFSPQSSGVTQPPAGMPICGGNLSDLRRWLDANSVDQIVFSHITRDDLSMMDLIRFFGDTCIPVSYAPTWVTPGMTFRVETLGAQPCIELWRPQDSLMDRQLKRSFDLVVSSVAILVLSPLLLGIALAVGLTSPGPVLFLQDRYGLDGRRFRIYKFRTMAVQEAGDQPGLRQATFKDPRITSIGHFLRRWSLDELPQLFNVLRGDMSVVGPRPHAVDHNEQYRHLIPGYMQRHLCKPGITGLAQVSGFRGETPTLQAMAGRVAADLEYQRDWSLARDVRILLMTLLKLRSGNAY